MHSPFVKNKHLVWISSYYNSNELNLIEFTTHNHNLELKYVAFYFNVDANSIALLNK